MLSTAASRPWPGTIGAQQLLIVRCDSPEDTDKTASAGATRLRQTAVNQTGGNLSIECIETPAG